VGARRRFGCRPAGSAGREAGVRDPGAKIDKVFDSLLDSSIEIIPVRHEANAAFMAAAVGRLTGKAGVALVTSGPGCSNLITGIATANSEGDPVVALGGAVKRADKASWCTRAWTPSPCSARSPNTPWR
jgi:thiamine pyrophosphate-dependent acetolactate synthase large subunit-like protein